MAETDSGFTERLRTATVRSFAVDTRALAAFRIALGSILLVDLARRSRNLVAFYTDAGVVPRDALSTQVQSVQHLSIHALSGSPTFQAILFGVAGIAALAILLGYRTKLAATVSLVLLLSLHIRNPAILHGGDSLLRQLLLWGLFLPLGERWAVDAVRREDQRASVVGLATAGVLLQVVLVYATNAVFKFRGDIWLQGGAIERVFALSRHATWAAELVAELPLVLTVADYAWLALLVGSPLLVVLHGWPRAALASAFVAGHAGMLVFMELGIFPLVGITALLPFFPPAVWDRVPAPPATVFERLASYRPDWRIGLPPLRSRVRPLLQVVLAVLLVGMFAINGVSLGYVDAPDGSPAVLENKAWDMFAPYPPAEDGYYVMPATLQSGETVEALRHEPVAWEPPPDVSRTYGNERWRKLLYQLGGGTEAALREPVAEHLCWRWNERHDDRMEMVQIVYVTDPIDGSASERLDYGTYGCG
ncbi:MAG: HTTM domain-containing protein [Haloarculaceae archaeon]